MKRFLSLVIVGILVLSGLGAVALSEDETEQAMMEIVTFSQPALIEEQDYITIELSESDSYTMEIGKPAMPVVTKMYAFPFGTEITNVDVTFDMINEQAISKPIKPAPEPQVVSAVLKSNVVKEKVQVHQTVITYPNSPYSYRVGAGLNNGEHVVYLALHLHPVIFTPATHTISYSEVATIDISYTLPAQPVTFGDAYDLLIITPAEFTIQLQPLVTHKNDIGIATNMVTLDDIPSVGVDEQEDIKYYIKDAIETWGISSVLLVGAGVEGEEIFPVRNAWIKSGNYEDYFPSDLYYADIYDGLGGFSTWDDDGNGKYCEYPQDIDAVDLYPDVALCRLPCNDANEVTIIVDKIINYKEHNKMMDKIAQAGGDTFPGDSEGIYEGEFANEEVLTKLPGYSTERLWGSNGKLTKANIRKAFNGGVDFFDFSGHGSWASWATHPPDDDGTWIPAKTFYSPYTGFLYYDVSFLTNAKKLPVIFLNACSTSKYSDSPNCLSWKLLSKSGGGGIATFGASGIGYGSHGSHETERLFGWMEVHVFEELYNTKVLGEVWVNALNGYINSFELDDGDYKTIVEMTLFGDPTLAIEDGDDPESINYQVSNVLPSNQQSTQSIFYQVVQSILGRTSNSQTSWQPLGQ